MNGGHKRRREGGGRALRIGHRVAQRLEARPEELLERGGAARDVGLFRVVVAAVVEDLGHIANKVGQSLVAPILRPDCAPSVNHTIEGSQEDIRKRVGVPESSDRRCAGPWVP